ncbi:MAG TPA: cyclic pyranopterin monophosphate synthase MoaC [Candidatus Atribacteria bacterium]|nr:cyclic pyranopterin monophosphate synthase MoaC [Candidatus Atribacteria bacterium]
MSGFSHIDKEGNPHMVDISEKKPTTRTAKAYGKVVISKEVYEAIKNNTIVKGPVLETAKIAGILGAKKTHLIIPLTHPLLIEYIDIEFNIIPYEIEIISHVKMEGKTGAEMEALTAVSTAALTIYDMCKALDKKIIISEIKLLEKTGGKSGTFKREKG